MVGFLKQVTDFMLKVKKWTASQAIPSIPQLLHSYGLYDDDDDDGGDNGGNAAQQSNRKDI